MRGGWCLPRCVRIQSGACICGCYDWSHALVLFVARGAGKRPVILILLIIDAVAALPTHRQKTCSSVNGGKLCGTPYIELILAIHLQLYALYKTVRLVMLSQTVFRRGIYFYSLTKFK